ncbi:MAG: hypothetical protein ACK5M3_16260 [Dysgonomonas sp.]
MKRIIIIFILATIAITAYSQCNQPYKAFNTFAKDTTAFLRYNFKERADCYKGKTIAYILSDLQLKPISFTILYSTYTGKYKGIRIFIDNNKWYESPTRKAQYIYIYWSELLNNQEIANLVKNYDNDIWIQKHYDFFKNMVVGRVAYYE